MLNFTLESMPNTEFRFEDVSPIDLLALSGTDFKDMKQRRDMYGFVLEHTSVKIGEKWTPVFTPSKGVYMPVGMKEKVAEMDEICAKFMTEVLFKAFPKSSE